MCTSKIRPRSYLLPFEKSFSRRKLRGLLSAVFRKGLLLDISENGSKPELESEDEPETIEVLGLEDEDLGADEFGLMSKDVSDDPSQKVERFILRDSE